MGHSADGRRRVTANPDTVDDSACQILHVDMDAFFAAVELLDRPDLRGTPMMVAGIGGRGVVLSATYEARRHGVRSGMPTGQARALCPGMVVLPPDHRRYQAVSRQVMALFRDVTPLVEPLSVDEAFLDVSGAWRTAGRPAVIAERLRARIKGELGLTATVGAAANKFVAKLASGLAKPDGLLVVPPGDVRALLDPLPVRALWGVGPRTAVQLESLGLSSVGEIARTDRTALCRAIGNALGGKLHDLANGLDGRGVVTDRAERSIGAETTFDTDTADRVQIDRVLLGLADRTARRARAAGLRGRAVSIKVRYRDFTTVSRTLTLAEPTDLSRDIHHAVQELMSRIALAGRQLRLVGVRLEGLAPAETSGEQLALDTVEEGPGWREAEAAMDRVSARFGDSAVQRATLLAGGREPGPSRAARADH